jgi:low affinity Fe/Cu permease
MTEDKSSSDEMAAPGGPGAKLAAFANWFNENIVGSPWTYLACIILVVVIYAVIPLQGYSKWNLSTGLFFNTASSSVELITGVGAVVGVYAVRRGQKQHREETAAHRSEVKALHAKLDALLRHHGENRP